MKKIIFFAIVAGASLSLGDQARAATRATPPLAAPPSNLWRPVFPKSPPPAKRLLLADIDRQPAAGKFLVLALQGLVNRKQPRLYVYDRQYEGGNDIALHRNMRDWWQEELFRRGYRFQAMNQPRRLLTRFRSAFRGAILYEKECWTNPDLAQNINAITMLCGLNDLVPVTPEMNRTLRLPVRLDVRGRWRSAADVDLWAANDPQLKATCNRRVSAIRHPWSLYLTDYVVANKMFVFWFGKKAFQEAAARERYTRFLDMTAPNTPVLGAWQSWWAEITGRFQVGGTG